LESVWPLVQKENPRAHLHVCGSIADHFQLPLPGVTFLGRVDQLAPAYAKAAVVVVPLLNGSGMKIKLVEACSFGKACVTTSVGLQGLGFLRAGVLCEDKPEGFAAGICRILADAGLKHKLGAASLLAMQNHLSREKCYTPLLNWLLARPGSVGTSSPQPGLTKSKAGETMTGFASS
jgi:glycosyltransferase involved in cell wall biosynthesis